MGRRYRTDEQKGNKVRFAEEVKGYSDTGLWFIRSIIDNGLKLAKNGNAAALAEMKDLEYRLWMNRLRRDAAIRDVQDNRDSLSTVENELHRRKHNAV